MALLELQLVALNDSESSPGNFVLILEGPPPLRKRLPIIIGVHEAQSIALYMEKLQTARPLTHDLFVQTLQGLRCNLIRICIHQLIQHVYHCELHLEQNGTPLLIDARPSDAIALAIRFQAPIMMDAHLFEEMGMLDPTSPTLLRGSLWEYSLAELDMMLVELLAKEDYERAAKVRDIIQQKTARAQE